MDSLFSTGQLLPGAVPVTLSPGFLLKQGLDYVRQGDYAEGAALLALVRTVLQPQQQEIAAILDAFLQDYTRYKHAQQALQEVRIRYIEAREEQQMRVADFERLVLPFIKSLDDAHYPHEQGETATSGYPLSGADAAPQDLPASFSLKARVLHIEEKGSATPPEFSIACFGHFEVRRLGEPVALCASRNGQSIFRYLVAQAERCATSDILQALFWPNDAPEAAQRKLHIAISSLRRSLKSGAAGHLGECIVFKNGTYALATTVTIETDVDKFLRCYHMGQQNAAERVACYEQACSYYSGPFLNEDRYADWSFLRREQLSQIYLNMCKALAGHYLQIGQYDNAFVWATALLKENRCDEAAHRLLIQIYAAQGRRNEALQCYHRCIRLLSEELGVHPLPETQALYKALLASERVDLLDIEKI
ncbi:MAG: AfsR/SARP family transcriptional regulator [Ktedonobacteraceae bacterium]